MSGPEKGNAFIARSYSFRNIKFHTRGREIGHAIGFRPLDLGPFAKCNRLIFESVLKLKSCVYIYTVIYTTTENVSKCRK